MIILFNPSAGRGRALKEKEALEKLLREHGVAYSLSITRSEDELKALAREFGRKSEILVGAGGDSTFHIIVNEMMRADATATFGMIGLGSSNDIAREFGIETLEKACIALKRRRVRSIDLGAIVRDGSVLRYFLGQANIGLGAEVNKSVASLSAGSSFWAGKQALAGARGILKAYHSDKIPIPLSIKSEQGNIQGRFTLALFANIRYWATGRMPCPDARPDDGRLDACLIKRSSLIRLARVIRLAGKGKHIFLKYTQILSSPTYEVRSEIPFEIQTDGEILGGYRAPQQFTRIEFRAVPKALKIIC